MSRTSFTTLSTADLDAVTGGASSRATTDERLLDKMQRITVAIQDAATQRSILATDSHELLALRSSTRVSWVAREIVAPSGLAYTTPDMPEGSAIPFAHGHSSKLPLGRRVVIPATNPTNALASATGFVSTAADLARQLGHASLATLLIAPESALPAPVR